ncbi:MAG TPA: hypothetical protein VN369_05990 [Terriglobales bacterium]|nr:hypothetical protein [Terriglobales bacterium]
MAKMYDYIGDRNYTEEINTAVEAGDYEMAAELERQRNAKLDGEGLSYAKTYNYNDAPDASPSASSGSLEGSSWADKLSISGGSGYGGNIDKLLRRYLNRDPFSYDYTTDPLYQQYADQYTRLGDLAMKDTLGQVSARTGGLASTYATAASQGAYDSYMQALAAKIPELYSLAYSMYQDEGDRQLQNINLLRGLQSDDRSWEGENWSRNFQTKQYADNQAQQTLENQWYGEQVARGIKQDALQAAMSNALSQADWQAKKEQYLKTGKGGAEVANYETWFDYMTALTDYYAGRLS